MVITVDVFTRSKRSEIMSRIKSANSKPELLVRRLLHGLGYRFRLHSAKLPGKPDIVFASRRKVIFVHGCFWHGHSHCSRASLPSTNEAFWESKIASNKHRDQTVRRRLREDKWQVLVVWQCQTRRTDQLQERLVRFLTNVKEH